MLNMLEKPSKRVLTLFNGTGYMFALCAIASAIAWIYYVAKAVRADRIGGPNGVGETGVNLDGEEIDTIQVMFQGVVISVIFYQIARHHFRCHE